MNDRPPEPSAVVRGELVASPSWVFLRALAILSGFVLLRGLLSLFVRYCLCLRRHAVAEIRGSGIELEVWWTLLGRPIRHTKTVALLSDLRAVQLLSRQRYLYVLVGFGALAVGTWLGIQWFVDGLRAGYPQLALLGAGIVVCGVVIDLALFALTPAGTGRQRLVLVLGPWRSTLAGVEPDAAKRFLSAAQAAFESFAAKRHDRSAR